MENKFGDFDFEKEFQTLANEANALMDDENNWTLVKGTFDSGSNLN